MAEFCSLYSGSRGNALFVRDKSTRILIDVGMSKKKIVTALNDIGEDASRLDAILISHEHKDHIQGVKVFFKKYGIPVYANERTWECITKFTEDVIPENEKRYFCANEEFRIGDIVVRPFSISHDAADPVGFNFFVDDKKITTATDLGYISKSIVTALEDSDFIFLESNHDKNMLQMGAYPWPLKKRIAGKEGHLSNDIASKAVAYFASRGTGKFMLGHLSQNNNFPELVYQSVKNEIEAKGMLMTNVCVDVARQDVVSEVKYI